MDFGCSYEAVKFSPEYIAALQCFYYLGSGNLDLTESNCIDTSPTGDCTSSGASPSSCCPANTCTNSGRRRRHADPVAPPVVIKIGGEFEDIEDAFQPW